MKHSYRFKFPPLKPYLIIGMFILINLPAMSQDQRVIRPYEKESGYVLPNPIDSLVKAKLKEQDLVPANLCSDEVFIRRVYIDVIGTLPETQDVLNFLQDRNPNKRAVLIDNLLKREEFADYWALKWCDILRVKSEFPINLWPNAVQSYHRWIRESIRTNKPYNQFARELLTSSGSNFRNPPVNFYRAVQSHDPNTLASAVGLSLMGTRTEKWPESKRAAMSAFFSRVAYKGSAEWKEEIVYLDPTTRTAMNVVFPDGTKAFILPDKDPRQVFADWLITPENPWFARNAVNRVWFWLLGRGIIQEPDDIREDNPPTNPALLSYLEKELVKSNYDLKHIYRIILNSRTYQQSSLAYPNNPKADVYFAHYPVRRLDAETLIDALIWIGGPKENYSSAIPEPFTYIPDYHRTISLADGSITSPFLELFGRPPRDSGLESERNNEPTDDQRVYLLNSNTIQNRISYSIRLFKIYNNQKKKIPVIIQNYYLTILSRYPTSEEVIAAENYFNLPGQTQKQAADDLAWALVNSKEFLYRH